MGLLLFHVIGVDQVGPGPLQQLVLAIAQQAAEPLVDFDPVLFFREHGHAHQRLLEVAAEALLAFQEVFLRLGPLGDLAGQRAIGFGQFRAGRFGALPATLQGLRKADDDQAHDDVQDQPDAVVQLADHQRPPWLHEEVGRQ